MIPLQAAGCRTACGGLTLCRNQLRCSPSPARRYIFVCAQAKRGRRAGSGDTGVNSTAPPNPAAARVRVVRPTTGARSCAHLWLGKGAHLPAVPREGSTCRRSAARKPTNANSLKAQGWGVLPVFLDSVVDSGLHQIPLFAGSPTLPCRCPQQGCEPFDTWQTSFGRVLKEHNVAILDQCSATITLLDAQRFGELDTDEALQKTPTATANSRLRADVPREASAFQAAQLARRQGVSGQGESFVQ